MFLMPVIRVGRGLRLTCDRSYLLADNGIQKRGLSGIGTSCDSNEKQFSASVIISLNDKCCVA